MCGIAGIISRDSSLVETSLLKKMTDIISHRGPDGEGHWISGNGQVGLGHRRLSIIDLSHEADQPMHYMNRYTLVFNGEIYNYLELRENLIKQGYQFKTQSDTEVFMALYDKEKENCLSMLDGMFAFILYDEKEQRVFGGRDRFGEKPLFFHYEKGKTFVFGSELKCLWAAGVPKEVNKKMMYNYLNYGFISNPDDITETFYTNCTRFKHAHFFTLDLNTFELTIKPYYKISLPQFYEPRNEKHLIEQFNELFYTSVTRRLRSDVAVGSSLSGGLDSSLVVKVIDEIKKGSHQTQNTFSAVFPGFAKDESKFIDLIVKSSNVNPYYVTPSDEDIVKDLDKLAYHQEEPFGSASIYVQYRVMQLAKENNTTVLLDGQGADEILAGYHAYYSTFFRELNSTNKTEHHIQRKAYLGLHKNNSINARFDSSLKNKIIHLAGSKSTQLRKWYQLYRSFKNPVMNKDFEQAFLREVFEKKYSYPTLNHHLLESTMGNELFHLLRYADRNSMAHSREVRLPFLFHELVDFLFTLPSEYKIHNGWTKYIMRKSFGHLLPQEICWRKDKIGYEPPQKNWLEHAVMKEKIMESRRILVHEGILNPKVMNRAPEAHGVNEYGLLGWGTLMAGLTFKQFS